MWDSLAIRGLLIAAAVLIVMFGVFAAAFAYVVESSGGGDPEPMSQEQVEQAETEMAKLASLEDARAELDRRVVGVTDIVARFVPSMTFSWNDGSNPTRVVPCDGDTRGRRANSRFRAADSAIPDDVWPDVHAAVRKYLGILDDQDSQIMQSKPGLHDANFYTPDGYMIQLGTQVHTVVNGSSPCLLPQAVKDAVLAGR